MMGILKIWLLLIFVSGFIQCREENISPVDSVESRIIEQSSGYEVNPAGLTIKDRFPPPLGFKRVNVSSHSFGSYLRTLPLKRHGSKVNYYNGNVKPADNVYLGVVDLPIGSKNLHQCADAVMRLRADYLWQEGRYEDIHFNFTNGFRVDYEKWMQGNRIEVSGNNVVWKLSSNPKNDAESFWQYLETIFMYAGTLSLEKEMKKVEVNEMEIGDVFIQGGSPGHAVIVIDIVEKEGEHMFLLAQSYMPAQEIQILLNPSDPGGSPWYKLSEGDRIITPEWTFSPDDLRRFN